ncbi:MAG: polyprenyl diphosphate synthase, partial [Mobiluncus sp.]|uniref:polyprenyl diphosphate synthase n=1 Tax=Mobiluncus sp. TaxID=47293 RepID=UPI00258E956A
MNEKSWVREIPAPFAPEAPALPAELEVGAVGHVAIIMDGNGRWAKQRGLERSEGHKAGAKVFKQICDYAGEIGVQCVTFYAFSTENWKRPPQEVSSLMDLFREYMHEAEDRKAENLEKGMRMHFIGHREGIPEDLLNLFDTSEEES